MVLVINYAISVWKDPKLGHTWKPSQHCAMLAIESLSCAQTFVISLKKLLQCQSCYLTFAEQSVKRLQNFAASEYFFLYAKLWVLSLVLIFLGMRNIPADFMDTNSQSIPCKVWLWRCISLGICLPGYPGHLSCLSMDFCLFGSNEGFCLLSSSISQHNNNNTEMVS